ncbi:ABC transporter ATP-binding protein [Desulfobulbus alkaliphilus]|uniref:ABC transporter ATP-binding protein n=1 Tax=Desulfobulbus alkaliphilus TaxID=869814 RepID=UPI001962ACBB|nr:ABC transporter ATP-binding protein [Desulfobulbus alkaliphilus]MBM9538360.1 ABC transporter ATP-binding protein [Desulfobulbus alkaliphilus]
MSPPPQPTGTLTLIKRLWGHLNRLRKVQCLFLAVLMQVSAVAEMISLGAILPFIGVLTSPERVLGHPVVAGLAGRVGIVEAQQLLLPVTVLFVSAALVAGGVRLLQLWANTRFAYAVGHDLSAEIYRRTLYQPYPVHLSRNSSEVISGVYKVEGAIQVLLQLLIMISGCVLVLAIALTLLAIDPLVAGIAFGGFGLMYGGMTRFSRSRLSRNSQRIALESNRRLKALQEGLGGIRYIILGNKQASYCEMYRKADWPMRKAQGYNALLAGAPRFTVEALGIAMLAFLAYGLARQSGDMVAALPVLGALAMGAQRMLPALQIVYNGWAYMAGSKASLVDVLDLLDQPLPEAARTPMPKPLPFTREVHFDHVSFRYSEAGPLVLDKLDLAIPRGARVGFVGATGSGKSTTLDLFMGLLAPTSGRIVIDDRPLFGDVVRSWQRNIAHVPQSIFLADATVAENIAFGHTLATLDMDRVRKAARKANIAEFIENHPDGYQAFVGERGIRLSGGQRQRVGIARALYEQAEVLVFDEATSALDNVTERSVMQAIADLGPDLTILIIAHRLSTVRSCDVIVELDQGRVVAQGNYDDLLSRSESFRKMASNVEV